MKKAKEFKFELGQAVEISCSGEQGEVISRSEHSVGKDQYQIRYKAADGRAVEVWWPVNAIKATKVVDTPKKVPKTTKTAAPSEKKSPGKKTRSKKKVPSKS